MRWLFVFALLLSTACQAQQPPLAAKQAARGKGTTGMIEYGQPRKLADLADKRIKESSGIAISRTNPGCFWTHSDEGGPRLFLIDREGNTLAMVRLDDAKLKDWEDIASFSRGGKNYLLVADTGDNNLDRDKYRLYLIEEPRIDAEGKPPKKIDFAMEIEFRYADARHNCEAMGVDPTTNTIVLITKERKRGAAVYELPLPAEEPKKDLVVEPVGYLALPTIVALDISPDGRRAIVLSDEAYAYEYTRGANETWREAFRRQPRALLMPPRKHGESICYGTDGRSLYLTSEGEHEPLWEVPAVK
jgi:hypothetical protein